MRNPLFLPFSGQTDVNGNTEIDLVARRAFWTLVTVTAESQGLNASWTLGRGPSPISYSDGPRMISGPHLLPPQETLRLLIGGATANAAVNGSLTGFETDDESALPVAFPQIYAAKQQVSGAVSLTGPVGISGNVPVVNPAGGQLNVAAPQQQIDAGTATNLFPINKTVSLPPGTHGLILGMYERSFQNTLFSALRIRGGMSGFTYLDLSTKPLSSGANVQLPIAVNQGQDTSITLNITPTTLNASVGYYLIAILDTEIVTVQGGASPIPVYLTQEPVSGLSTRNRGSMPPNRPADFNISLLRSATIRPTITFIGQANYRLLVAAALFTLLNIGGPTQASIDVSVWDGPFDTGTVIWNATLFVGASYAVDRVAVPSGVIASSPGNSLSFSFPGAGSTVFYAINAAGWLLPA